MKGCVIATTNVPFRPRTVSAGTARKKGCVFSFHNFPPKSSGLPDDEIIIYLHLGTFCKKMSICFSSDAQTRSKCFKTLASF